MLHPVVVDLDRELRALDAEDLEQLLRLVVRLDRRQRLRHPPEDDPPVLALEPNRDESAKRLQPDLLERPRRAEDERRAECRMPRERHLP